MKQKLFPLCVALLALVLCNTPLFAEDFEVDGIYYNITSSTDKTVAVTYRGPYYYSYSDEYSGAVTIPESVTYSGNTYSVTSIGYGAFFGCSSLTSVEIPNSVTSIGYVAFRSCSLTSVVIPNSVTSIESSAFCECSSLTSVVIPNSVTSIGDYAFSYCSSLTSVVIPNSVTSIGDDAFSSCYNLTSVEIPNSVTSIGNSAFEYCESLTSVEIPNSVTSIGSYAFNGCSSLTSVEIPNSVTSIGGYAFSDCSRLTSVVIGNNVTSILDWAFGHCSSLTSVVIGNSVTSIGVNAFWDCSSLTSVEIPNSVTSIGVGAFRYCSSLTSVEIPNSVTSIGDFAFAECSSLTTVTVGCSWKTNPQYEFNENVTIHATLHSYENGICTICGDEENHEEIMPEYIELVEGNDFTNGITREVAQVSYNRTLPNLKWNALYLPVEIPVSELKDNYDVAYFNNMHAYDRNNDGTVDEMDMEIFFITEGTLHANHPYFIRAKNNAAKQLNLVLTDVTLHSTEAANCTSITTSSAYMNFELKGVYKRIYVSNTNIPVNPNPEAPISSDYDSDESIYGCYAITASGAWSPIAVGSYLNPFRLYLKMTDRDGTPVKMDQALQTIRIRVHGEDGTTDIEEHCINGQQSTTIYDLQGRRVVNPDKGIYIVNGKKVMIK